MNSSSACLVGMVQDITPRWEAERTVKASPEQLRERAEPAGGTCAISRGPGRGTTARLDVPLDAAQSLP